MDDLDDMKQLWRTLSTRVTNLEHARATDRTRGAVRGAIAGEIAKLVVWAAFLAFAAPMIPDTPVAAGAITAYAAAGIALGVVQLRAALRIDFAGSIVALQRDLLALDRLRAWCSLALGLPWWVLWIAFPIVLAAHGGVDLIAVGDLRFVILLNVAVGVIGFGAHVAIARALARRAPTSPRIRRFLDGFAATRLRRAAEALGDVAQFAQ